MAEQEPTPAATVLLARDRAPCGFEVYLLQRNQRIGFMGGMYVFPGGKLAASDQSAATLELVIDPEAHLGVWAGTFAGAMSAGLAVAAIRETFEEAGVLLCDNAPVDGWIEARARLLQGEDFAALLQSAGLRLKLSSLVPLSRWITPAVEPRRYDTCFYIAHAPPGQVAAHDQSETVAGRWRSAQEALAEMAAGEIRLSPPTARTLESLLPCESVADAEAYAAARPPPLIEPIIRAEGDEIVLLMPGDEAHPVAQRALPGPTRSVLRKR